MTERDATFLAGCLLALAIKVTILAVSVYVVVAVLRATGVIS